MSYNSDQDSLDKLYIQMQIYETILKFKEAEPNPYGLKIHYTFRYNSFQPKDNMINVKPSTKHLYVYVLSNLKRYLVTDQTNIDNIVERSMTVTLHPDVVGIPRQHIKIYLDELVEINFIAKVGVRGYDYYVNPYYYNVLSKPLAHHCFTMMLQLLRK